MATVDKARESAPLPENAAQEVEKLLTLAEGLEQRCESWERQITWMLAATVALLGLAFPVVVRLVVPRTEGGGTVLVQVVSGVITGGSAALMFIFALQVVLRMKRHLRRDQRALYEIVGMLREIESALAQRNQLSALERAEIRIRLARFDIGPEDGHKPRW
jgi:hypothetical protein